METKRKQQLFQLISLVLPLLILIPVFWSIDVTPFGNSNLLVSDLGTQYVPFFSYFKEMLLGDGRPLYSFSSGMGDDFLPLAAYYLMSPFNVLFLIVPKIHLASAVTLVIMLKICFISGAMFFYLSRTYGKAELAQLFFALAYAFCGFVGIYLYNIMWLDALIWLPILVLSIQYLVDRGNKLFYCFSLFAVIVSNYYLGYMSCLFALCYFIYWTVRQTEISGFRDYFQKTFKKWRSFITYSLIGAGLSSFILVPAALGMLQTGKSMIDWRIFLPLPRFGIDALLQLGFENTEFSSRLDHLPTIFIGSLLLILAVSYFFIGTISRKEKALGFSMLLILFVSFWLQGFNTVWHMFQLTAGFPYRNAYMLSFFLILLSYESWQRRHELSESTIMKVTASLIALLAVGYLYSWQALPWLIKNIEAFQVLLYQSAVPLHPYLFWVSAGALLLSCILFIWSRLSKRRQWLLFAVVCLELGYNFQQMLADTPVADNSRFQTDMANYSQLLNKMKEQDHDFFRIENAINGVDNGYNESFLYGYHSTPYYSSTLNENLRSSLVKLGLFSKNERRISDVGQTPFLDYLFNTRYILDESKPEEADFAIAKSSFGQVVPKNPGVATSIGYALSTDFEKVTLKEMQPFANQNALAESILPNSFPLFQEAQVIQSVAANSYIVTPATDGPLYLYLPKVNLKKVRIYVDGVEVIPHVKVTNQALIHLGDFNRGKQIYLELQGKKRIKVTPENIRTLDGAVYYQTIRKMEQSRLIVKDWKASEITGEVQVKDKEEVLFISIPYDSKWKAEVDGEKVKLSKVAGNFIGIPLSKGIHEIHLEYSPEGFQLGSWISYGCLLLLSGLVGYDLSRKYKLKKSAKS